MNFLRRKSVADLQAEAKTNNSLKRALGRWHLLFLGIGGTIGAGVFVLTGHAAAENAGPAVVFSYILAGTASIFAAFCYSEFASLVPMSGSAYTYSYATLGELFAWIIGWDLILEYAVGAMTVAIGWSGNVVKLLDGFGLHVPPQLAGATKSIVLARVNDLIPGSVYSNVSLAFSQLTAGQQQHLLQSGDVVVALFNLPAIVIVGLATALLVVGIHESAQFNNIIVLVKLVVIMTFVIGAASAIKLANWHPFIPAYVPELPAHDGIPAIKAHFGWWGIFTGAGTVFFAYIGFDAVSTAAQEAKNPQKDMPFGIIGSLIACTILYILVAAVATGVVPYPELGGPAPIVHASEVAGMGWMSTLINIGIVAGLSSVIMVLLLGQSRIFWSMSRDGLLPPFVNKVHPQFQTPWITSILTGVVVAAFAATLTLGEAGDLCNIGTLLAFLIVCVSVLVLRVREPHHKRAFVTPAIWAVAPLGALSAFGLMLAQPPIAWKRLVIWFIIGIIIYFAYSFRHSRLRHHLETRPPLPPTHGP
jgi:APA family basic amino acid/polyamine antiporter